MSFLKATILSIFLVFSSFTTIAAQPAEFLESVPEVEMEDMTTDNELFRQCFTNQTNVSCILKNAVCDPPNVTDGMFQTFEDDNDLKGKGVWFNTFYDPVLGKGVVVGYKHKEGKAIVVFRPESVEQFCLHGLTVYKPRGETL